MTHVRVWKFRPPEGGEQRFAEAYGDDGPWARLFRMAPGFAGTSLLGPVEPGGWWLTLDRWNSRSDFEAFQRDFGDEYHSLDADLEGLAGEEMFVGAFEDEDE